MSELYAFPAEQYILIGKVTKAHGLKGDVRCSPFSDLWENIVNKSRFALIADDGRMTKILESEKIRIQGKRIILKLETIDTRDEAELTVGMGVLLWREDIPESDEDRLYPHQVEGLKVRIASSKNIIGIVHSSFSNGAQEIIVVRDDMNEYLIPLVKEIVISLDEEEIVIDPPPGLLEINSSSDR